MKSKSLYYCIASLLLFALSHSAHAIKREDVLECGLPDGSKFVLRSQYDWNWFPLPAYHSSRVTNRGSWVAEYVDATGEKSYPGGSVHYSGTANPGTLRGACARFGMLRGVPIAAFTYKQMNSQWFHLVDFPWSKLLVDVGSTPDILSPAMQKIMRDAGIKRSVYNFGYILPIGDRMLFEQPLFNESLRKVINSVISYDIVFAAVYQSFSTDNGKTWSDPIVTTDAKIFEIGKSWLEQSFIARPISLNGKPIEAD